MHVNIYILDSNSRNLDEVCDTEIMLSEAPVIIIITLYSYLGLGAQDVASRPFLAKIKV